MRYLEDISYYENLPNFPKSPEKREAFYRGYERAKKAQETILEDSYLPPIEEYERRSDFPTDPEKQKQFINGYFEIMRRRVKNSEGAVNYYDTQRDYILNKIKSQYDRMYPNDEEGYDRLIKDPDAYLSDDVQFDNLVPEGSFVLPELKNLAQHAKAAKKLWEAREEIINTEPTEVKFSSGRKIKIKTAPFQGRYITSIVYPSGASEDTVLDHPSEVTNFLLKDRKAFIGDDYDEFYDRVNNTGGFWETLPGMFRKSLGDAIQAFNFDSIKEVSDKLNNIIDRKYNRGAWKIPQRGDFDSDDDYKDAMQKWRNNQSQDYLFNPRGGLTSIFGGLSRDIENTARAISNISGGTISYNPTLNKTYDELINAYSSDLADRWKEFLDKQKELDSIKLSRSFKKFQDYIQEEQGKNDSFSGIISYFAKKPADFFQFVGAIGAMSLPDAAMGISSALLNPGIGFTYGATREYTASFLSAFNEYIQEKGIDVSDSNALRAALDDPDLRTKTERIAAIRGVAVGASEALFGHVFRKIGENIKTSLKRVTATSAADVAAAAGGEAAAGLLSGTYSASEVFSEAVGEAPGSVVISSVAELGRKIKNPSLLDAVNDAAKNINEKVASNPPLTREGIRERVENIASRVTPAPRYETTDSEGTGEVGEESATDPEEAVQPSDQGTEDSVAAADGSGTDTQGSAQQPQTLEETASSEQTATATRPVAKMRASQRGSQPAAETPPARPVAKMRARQRRESEQAETPSQTPEEGAIAREAEVTQTADETVPADNEPTDDGVTNIPPQEDSLIDERYRGIDKPLDSSITARPVRVEDIVGEDAVQEQASEATAQQTEPEQPAQPSPVARPVAEMTDEELIEENSRSDINPVRKKILINEIGRRGLSERRVNLSSLSDEDLKKEYRFAKTEENLPRMKEIDTELKRRYKERLDVQKPNVKPNSVKIKSINLKQLSDSELFALNNYYERLGDTAKVNSVRTEINSRRQDPFFTSIETPSKKDGTAFYNFVYNFLFYNGSSIGKFVDQILPYEDKGSTGYKYFLAALTEENNKPGSVDSAFYAKLDIINAVLESNPDIKHGVYLAVDDEAEQSYYERAYKTIYLSKNATIDSLIHELAHHIIYNSISYQLNQLNSIGTNKFKDIYTGKGLASVDDGKVYKRVVKLIEMFRDAQAHLFTHDKTGVNVDFDDEKGTFSINGVSFDMDGTPGSYAKNVEKFNSALKSGLVPRMYYGLIDINEFLPEALSNKEFQKYLNSIPYRQSKSLLHKLFNLIGRILGIPPNKNSLLHHSLSLIEDILSGDSDDLSLPSYVLSAEDKKVIKEARDAHLKAIDGDNGDDNIVDWITNRAPYDNTPQNRQSILGMWEARNPRSAEIMRDAVMKAAAANGFRVPVFHSVAEGYLQGNRYDTSKLGENTGAPSAKQGIFTSRGYDTANAYINPENKEQDEFESLKIDFERDPNKYKNWMIGTIRAMSKIPYGGSQERANFHMSHQFDKYLRKAPPDNPYRDAVSFFNAWESGEINHFPTYLDVYEFRTWVNILNERFDSNLDAIEIPRIVNSSGTMYPLLIRAENPLIEDDKSRGYREDSYYNRIIRAKEGGHDSLVIKNTYDGGPLDDVWVVFSPNQLKSSDIVTLDENNNVIPLDERFNDQTDNIYYTIESSPEDRAAIEKGADSELRFANINGNYIPLTEGLSEEQVNDALRAEESINNPDDDNALSEDQINRIVRDLTKVVTATRLERLKENFPEVFSDPANADAVNDISEARKAVIEYIKANPERYDDSDIPKGIAIVELMDNRYAAQGYFQNKVQDEGLPLDLISMLVDAYEYLIDRTEDPDALSLSNILKYNQIFASMSDGVTTPVGLYYAVTESYKANKIKELNRLLSNLPRDIAFDKPISNIRRRFALFRSEIWSAAPIAAELKSLAPAKESWEWINRFVSGVMGNVETQEVERNAVMEEYDELVNKLFNGRIGLESSNRIGWVANLTQYRTRSEDPGKYLVKHFQKAIGGFINMQAAPGMEEDFLISYRAFNEVTRNLQERLAEGNGEEVEISADEFINLLESSLSPEELAVLRYVREVGSRYRSALSAVSALSGGRQLEEWENYVHWKTNQDYTKDKPFSIGQEAFDSMEGVLHIRNELGDQNWYESNINTLFSDMVNQSTYEKYTGVQRSVMKDLMNSPEFKSLIDGNIRSTPIVDRLKLVIGNFHSGMINHGDQGGLVFRIVSNFVRSFIALPLIQGKAFIKNAISSASIRAHAALNGQNMLAYELNKSVMDKFFEENVPTVHKREGKYDVFYDKHLAQDTFLRQIDKIRAAYGKDFKKYFENSFRLSGEAVNSLMNSFNRHIANNLLKIINGKPETFNYKSAWTAQYLATLKEMGRIANENEFFKNPFFDSEAATITTNTMDSLVGFASRRQAKGSVFSANISDFRFIGQMMYLYSQQQIGLNVGAQTAIAQAIKYWNSPGPQGKQIAKDKMKEAAVMISNLVLFRATSWALNSFLATGILYMFMNRPDDEEDKKALDEVIRSLRAFSTQVESDNAMFELMSLMLPAAPTINASPMIGAWKGSRDIAGIVNIAGPGNDAISKATMFDMVTKETVRQSIKDIDDEIKMLRAEDQFNKKNFGRTINDKAIEDLEYERKQWATVNKFRFFGPDAASAASEVLGAQGLAIEQAMGIINKMFPDLNTDEKKKVHEWIESNYDDSLMSMLRDTVLSRLSPVGPNPLTVRDRFRREQAKQAIRDEKEEEKIMQRFLKSIGAN